MILFFSVSDHNGRDKEKEKKKEKVKDREEKKKHKVMNEIKRENGEIKLFQKGMSLHIPVFFF